MFRYPGWVASAAIESGDCGEGRVEIIYWTWKAVLEEAIRIDRSDNVFKRCGMS